MIQVEFVGAAQTVTGSLHLIRTPHATVMLDCGLYQGRRREAYERNSKLPVDVRKVDAVVLSHAHIDHSGALPMLFKLGYEGPVYATPATRDLCAVMLQDAAMIQAADARYINRSIERDGVDMEHVEPLYSEKDVMSVLEAMISVPYRRKILVAPGVWVTLYDAGHVLGSAVTALDVEDGGKVRRFVFTGDLGRRNMPILRDPELVDGADVLLSESTYGDRLHAPIERMEEDLAAVLQRTYARGGKVIVPSFALERAQEILLALKGLRKQGRMPPMPVYVDSPLVVKITEVFKLHPECFDEGARAMIDRGDSPFDFEQLRYVSEVEDSKALSRDESPAVIVAASGMCEAGRVVHHLRAGIENEKNTVMIVGFQAQHTLGRRLVEKRAKVKIFGVERDRRAEVVVLNGFSAHADQSDLLDYATQLRSRGHLDRVLLVHGEPKPQQQLSELLRARGFGSVAAPAPGTKLEV